MAFPVSNVVISSDTFSVWVERTNTLCDLMTREAITANSLSTGAITTGNAFVNGIFSAQTFAVNVGLRGGNVNTSANLAIVSNAVFTGAVINATSNVAFYNSNVYVNTASLNVVGGIINATSNVSVLNVNTFIVANTTSITGGLLNVTSNVTATQANITLNTTALIHVGATMNSGANVTLTGTVHAVGGNVAFDTNTLFVDSVNNRVGIGNTTPDALLLVEGTANVTGASRLANTLTVVGAITGSNTLSITGNTTLSNTLAVTGAATFSNTVAIANTLTINTDYVIDVFSNTNLGANVGTPVTVFSFSKAAYTTAKILAEVISGDSANSQGNEMILTHNGSNSTITVFGTVTAPTTANVGVFSTSINSTSVALNFTQTGANSKVKLVAHFLK